MSGRRLGLAAALLLAALVALWLSLRSQPSRAQLEPADPVARPDAARASPLTAELDAVVPSAAMERELVPRADAAPAMAPSKSEQLRPFRGRVLDVVTGQAVAAAVVVCENLEAETDWDGRFTTDSRMPPDFAEIAVHSLRRATHIRSVPRSELEWLGDAKGWLARIRIGPTFRFKVAGMRGDSHRWRARLVDDDEQWIWIDAVRDDPPWIRYDNPVQQRTPSDCLLEVENFEGTLRGSAKVATTIGIHPGVLLIEIDRELAGITGRVVDENQKPRGNTQVIAVPRSAGITNEERWPSAGTDGDGYYHLRGLTPGAYWLHASPRRGEEPRTIAFDAGAGENHAPDIVIPAEKLVGAIEGLLKSSVQDHPEAVVRLRAVDGRTFDKFDIVDPEQQGRLVQNQQRLGRGMPMEPVGFFEFQQVPEGEYEITVSSNDGVRWTPTPLRVRPPVKDLEIFRDDAGKTWQPRFDVRDAASDGRVANAHVQLVRDERWTSDVIPTAWLERNPAEPRFVEGSRFRWNVFAQGYGLASGTQDDFGGTEEFRPLTVRLSRGYGVRYVMRDVRGRLGGLGDGWAEQFAASELPPVAGVEVIADGVRAATSDENGFAVVSLPLKPHHVEFRAPGWIAIGTNEVEVPELERILRAPEIVVWLNAL